jgi:hypothetical protein
MTMIFVTIMAVSLMGFGTLIFLVYLRNQKEMFMESAKLTRELMEPIYKLCDVMCKYFEKEINDNQI